MTLDPAELTCMVTGDAQGIAAAEARRLARRGALVLCVDRADPAASVQPVKQRRAQLMQRRERQLPLGLDADDTDDALPVRASARYSGSAVLPIPGSPTSTSARLSPFSTEPRKASSALRSDARSTRRTA